MTFLPTIPVRKFNNKYPEITFYAPEEVHITQSCRATLKELEPVHITVTAACDQDWKPGLKPIVPVLLGETPVWNATDFSYLKVWVCLVTQLRKQLFALTWLLSLQVLLKFKGKGHALKSSCQRKPGKMFANDRGLTE